MPNKTKYYLYRRKSEYYILSDHAASLIQAAIARGSTPVAFITSSSEAFATKHLIALAALDWDTMRQTLPTNRQ